MDITELTEKAHYKVSEKLFKEIKVGGWSHPTHSFFSGMTPPNSIGCAYLNNFGLKFNARMGNMPLPGCRSSAKHPIENRIGPPDNNNIGTACLNNFGFSCTVELEVYHET